MKFLLVDQLSLYPEMDAYLPPPAPNLGVACLAGACRESGIPPMYYDLTGRFLHLALRDCADEIAALLHERDKARGENTPLGLPGGVNSGKELVKFLAACHDFCTHPSHEAYTDSARVYELSLALKTVLELYYERLKLVPAGDVKLVQMLRREILDFGADVIGFSAHTMCNPIVDAVIRGCVESGAARIVAGGPLTFRGGEKTLDDYFFGKLGIDAYVRGYAERTLPKLLESNLEPDKLSRVPNVRFMSGGRAVSGPDEDFFAAGSMPEPDFSVFDLDRYFFPERLLPVQTARGCYWKKCAFCRREVSLAGYREYGAEEAAAQISGLSAQWNAKYFCIGNECLHPRHAEEFSRALLEMQPASSVRMMVGCRPDSSITASTLELMYEAGFRTIFWGIESGSDRRLQRIGKGTTVKSNERVLRESAAAGISNLCFFIAGFPGESEEEAAETIKFIKKNRANIDFFRMNPFALFEDSIVFRNPESFGVADVRKNPGENIYDYSVERGITRPQASAIVTALHEAWEKNPGGYTSVRYKTIAAAGLGDEKIPFYFWQRCCDESAGAIE